MNVTEQAVSRGAAATAKTAVRSKDAGAYRLPIFVVCSLVSLGITFLLGKDLPWDALDYHLYAGLSAVHNRFAQDYFAAGPQSYFIPYAYVPFYALVRTGLSSLQISGIAALVQSGILWITYELALSCCIDAPPRWRVMLGVCAVAWALANPILLSQFGSSFADITTSELILGGWLLMLRAVNAPRLAPVFWGGLIVGAATALKLTNAVHAVAAFTLLLFVPTTWTGRLRLGLGYGAALGIGFTVVAAPWCYRLEQQFGNPLFPLLNGWFRSPEFITGRLVHYRFIPDSLSAALLRPFAIVNPVYMVQEELRAPDMRYALLVVLAILLLGRALYLRAWRARARTEGMGVTVAAGSSPDTRTLAALGCALAVDWVAWLTTSGNGRYFLSMSCVTAVVSFTLMFRMFRRQPKVLGYLIAVLFCVQGAQLAMGTEYRWNASAWDQRWVDVKIPPALARQPNLYFTMAFQSDAFLAAYLPSGSGFIDIAGQYPPSATGPSGARIQALVRRYSPRLRMLVGGRQLYEDDQHKSPRRSSVDAMLSAFGLRVDTSDCQVIVLRDLNKDVQMQYAAGHQDDPDAREHQADHAGVPLLSCHLIPAGPMPGALARQKADADRVLDRLEQACPRLFQPRGVQSQFFGRGWMRYYLNTDEIAWVSRGWVKFDDPITGDGVAFIGQEADWLRAPQPVLCGHRNGHYYAHLAVRTQSAHPSSAAGR